MMYSLWIKYLQISLIVIAIIVTATQMTVSVQHTRDGELLSKVNRRITTIDEELIVSREYIALLRSAAFVEHEAQTKYGMGENKGQTKKIKLKVNYNFILE